MMAIYLMATSIGVKSANAVRMMCGCIINTEAVLTFGLAVGDPDPGELKYQIKSGSAAFGLLNFRFTDPTLS